LAIGKGVKMKLVINGIERKFQNGQVSVNYKCIKVKEGQMGQVKETYLNNIPNEMDDLGIVHGIRHKEDLDECSSSYKNIDVVMEEQRDLVDVVVKLQPLGVIKG